MFNRLLIGILLVSFPLAVAAKDSIVWDFSNQQTPPGRWDVHGFSNIKATNEGLLISPENDGYMTARTQFNRSIDAVIFTLQTEQNMELLLLWKQPDIIVEGYNQLPFIVTGDTDVQEIDIDLSTLEVWDSRAPEFGMALPNNATILLKSIEFVSWNPIEKFLNGILSLWKFDVFAPQAVNFMWGPWLNFNPVARGDMFQMDPPLGLTAMWLVYIILFVAGLKLAKDLIRKNKDKSKALITFACVFAGLWLLLDLRMGSEILSYAITDWKNYILAEDGDKNLRNHLSFHETVSEILPELESQSPYLFLGPGKTIYFSAMRYYSYPHLAVENGPLAEKATIGFVFGNAEAKIEDNGKLVTSKGIIHPGPCEIVERYRDESALVKCNP